MAARVTPQRRFLVEQLICMELLGEYPPYSPVEIVHSHRIPCSLAFASVLRRPLLCHDLAEWFMEEVAGCTVDHVELVHGMDR